VPRVLEGLLSHAHAAKLNPHPTPSIAPQWWHQAPQSPGPLSWWPQGHACWGPHGGARRGNEEQARGLRNGHPHAAAPQLSVRWGSSMGGRSLEC
jgi:hypothetical protein